MVVLKDGFGEYVVGCEEEMEYVVEQVEGICRLKAR